MTKRIPFKWFTGDINWREYGATWVRTTDGGTSFEVVELTPGDGDNGIPDGSYELAFAHIWIADVEPSDLDTIGASLAADGSAYVGASDHVTEPAEVALVKLGGYLATWGMGDDRTIGRNAYRMLRSAGVHPRREA
jgi:hypothetical protein